MESYIISINGEEIAEFANIEIWRNCADSMKESRKANGVSYTNIATGNKIDVQCENANDTAIITKYWIMERAEKRRARIARRIYGKHIPDQKRYKTGNWHPVRRDGMSDQLWANIRHMTSKDCKNILQRYANIKRYAKPCAI